MIGYTVFMTPSAEELAQKQHIADSIQQVKEQQQIEFAKAQAQNAKADETKTEQLIESSENKLNTSVSDDYSSKVQKYDVFANSAKGDGQSFNIDERTKLKTNRFLLKTT